jgi:hypothetical protein
VAWQINATQPGVLRTVKIKAHSKLEALRKLGKNLRLFTDKLEVSGGLDMASQLSTARRRARIAVDTVEIGEKEADTAA